jgi:hypothetical protein
MSKTAGSCSLRHVTPDQVSTNAGSVLVFGCTYVMVTTRADNRVPRVLGFARWEKDIVVVE